jgi:hypothetical protein
MRRLLGLVLLAAPLLTGCIYSHITTPLDLDLDRTHLGDKVGTAEWQSVLGLVAWGDAGTQAAAKQGGPPRSTTPTRDAGHWPSSTTARRRSSMASELSRRAARPFSSRRRGV